MVLKWGEMMWLLFDEDKPFSEVYLGEAGNPMRDDQVQAVRYGLEVLVTGSGGDQIIPATAVVKGFGQDKDGQTLEALMGEGVVYSYALTPIS